MVRQDGEAFLRKRWAQNVAQKAGSGVVVDGTRVGLGNKMLIAQGKCIEELWKARTVVIYGLSLDPIDSELAAVCATGFNQERLEKIVIYNLESAGQCIQDRVKLLLPHACGPRVEWRAVRATT